MHRMNVNPSSGSLLMTVEEVADHLRIGRTRVYAYMSTGELPSVRVGKSRRVRRADVETFIEQHLSDGPDAA